MDYPVLVWLLKNVIWIESPLSLLVSIFSDRSDWKNSFKAVTAFTCCEIIFSGTALK